MTETYQFGPCGGRGGSPYDGSAYVDDTIAKLTFYWDSNANAFAAMTIEYSSGKQLTAGSTSKGTPCSISLVPGELIMSVAGQWNSQAYTGCISYLAFTTTMETNPVFGNRVEGRVDFQIQTTPDYFIQGFFGKSGYALDSIGVYLTTGPTTSTS
ncbi:jacalin-like lectin [Sorangium sp. So ce291]|uniref:jacalin-like lectin n=1 Tax=Sorangium sp. So ce291 TaxID=3133294 RepID=UPI003F614C31